MKRVFLFLATNIAVILVLSIVLRLLGVDQIQTAQGTINYQALLIFSFVFGMGGSFISLAISKWSAKRMTGAKVIQQPANPTEQWLVSTVQRLSQQAGIGMPEVAIYPGQEVNAFATGARRDSALVAVSVGLLNSMEKSEVEAVLAHEVSHVANGDMVTLTLLQGVLNTFVIFLSRIIGNIIDRAVFRSGSGNGIGYFMTVIALQIVLGILASFIVAAFSRYREYRADAGGANLAGRNNMIAALERLRRINRPAQLPEQLEAMGISSGKRSGLRALAMTHPPLEDRIKALQQNLSR